MPPRTKAELQTGQTSNLSKWYNWLRAICQTCSNLATRLPSRPPVRAASRCNQIIFLIISIIICGYNHYRTMIIMIMMLNRCRTSTARRRQSKCQTRSAPRYSTVQYRYSYTLIQWKRKHCFSHETHWEHHGKRESNVRRKKWKLKETSYEMSRPLSLLHHPREQLIIDNFKSGSSPRVSRGASATGSPGRHWQIWNTKTQKHKNTKTQKHKNTKTQKLITSNSGATGALWAGPRGELPKHPGQDSQPNFIINKCPQNNPKI